MHGVLVIDRWALVFYGNLINLGSWPSATETYGKGWRFSRAKSFAWALFGDWMIVTAFYSFDFEGWG